MRRLFGTAGIRGRYLETITTDLAFSLGAAVSYKFKAKCMCLGGDGRLTTPLLKLLVASGAMYVGTDVIDVGLVPMPTLPWSIKKLKCDVGIYVTASHNPPTDNGFKVFNNYPMELSVNEELEVEEIIRTRSWNPVDWDCVGKYFREDIVHSYINEIIYRLSPSEIRFKPKVLIDTANGAASQVTPQILKSLGANVYALNANIDGRFPGRIPEPRPDVLEPFIPLARELGVDVFFAHDGDGDRLAVVDPRYGFIKQDRILALIAYYKLLERRGTVIASIDCGNALKDVVEMLGGKLVITKLGKTHEGVPKYSDAILAGEPWKLIDPSWGPWVDGVYQAALIVKLMIEEGVGISKLMGKIPNYPQARYSILMDRDVREYVFEGLSDFIEHNVPKVFNKRVHEVLTIDGVRVNFEDKSWILIRKSGTEPKIRIYAESKNISELRDMINAVITKAGELAKAKGAKSFEVEGSLLP